MFTVALVYLAGLYKKSFPSTDEVNGVSPNSSSILTEPPTSEVIVTS